MDFVVSFSTFAIEFKTSIDGYIINILHYYCYEVFL